MGVGAQPGVAKGGGGGAASLLPYGSVWLTTHGKDPRLIAPLPLATPLAQSANVMLLYRERSCSLRL